jgi:hypothetical protein
VRVTAVVGHKQIIDQVIDRAFHVGPGAVGQTETHARAGLALAPHDLAHMLQLLRDALVGGDDGIEGVTNLAGDAGMRTRKRTEKSPNLHGMQRRQQLTQVEIGRRTAVQCGLSMSVGLATPIGLGPGFSPSLPRVATPPLPLVLATTLDFDSIAGLQS